MNILSRKLLSQLGLGLLLIGLAACKPANQSNDFLATDITGVDFGRNLSLTDHHGNPRNLSDFKGKVVALFFGYTHCPDVCPTTMVDLKHATKLLGARANELQVIFVTVDPERDTQQVLATYIPAFDPSFIGLHGSKEEIAAVLKDFKIFAAKVENKGRSGYTIDHSAGIYVFDKTGQVRLYVDYGSKPSEIAIDIEKLL
ncbi:MAG: SCO family protein [Methylotenera sp.]|nr:SCO family protein [Methylotenera sp.]